MSFVDPNQSRRNLVMTGSWDPSLPESQRGLVDLNAQFYSPQEGPPVIMDEISKTYYPGRGFLTDQEAYPVNMFNRAPRFGGGLNVPGAAGNLAMSIAANYTQPPYSPGTQLDIDMYNQMQMNPAGASFDPSQLNVQPKIQPGDPGYNPFMLERGRDRFILNDPRSGVAKLPYYGGGV